jgi:hypothetical protein
MCNERALQNCPFGAADAAAIGRLVAESEFQALIKEGWHV